MRDVSKPAWINVEELGKDLAELLATTAKDSSMATISDGNGWYFRHPDHYLAVYGPYPDAVRCADAYEHVMHSDSQFDLLVLSREMRPWVAHNFGNRQAWQPLAGVSEEVGELAVAVIRNDIKEALDAVADTGIFLMDFINALDLSYPLLEIETARSIIEPVPLDRWALSDVFFITVGKLNHHYLKMMQGIRGDSHFHRTQLVKWCGALYWALGRMALVLLRSKFPEEAQMGENHEKNLLENEQKRLMELIRDTWYKVKQRDFRKDSVNGGQ